MEIAGLATLTIYLKHFRALNIHFSGSIVGERPQITEGGQGPPLALEKTAAEAANRSTKREWEVVGDKGRHCEVVILRFKNRFWCSLRQHTDLKKERENRF